MKAASVPLRRLTLSSIHSRPLSALAILFVFLALVSLAPLEAQTAVPVAVGSRIRVTLPDPAPRFGVIPPERWLVGELVALSADTLAVRPHPLLDAIAVPRTALRRLEVSRGAPSRSRSAASGVFLGALVGVLWGQLLHDLDAGGDHFQTAARARSWGAVYGAASHAILGALFPRERWRRIPLN